MYAERQLIKEANFALYAGYYVLLCWFLFHCYQALELLSVIEISVLVLPKV